MDPFEEDSICVAIHDIEESDMPETRRRASEQIPIPTVIPKQPVHACASVLVEKTGKERGANEQWGMMTHVLKLSGLSVGNYSAMVMK